MKQILYCLSALLYVAPQTLDAQTRDPFLWPYQATSIWNTPIGSEAVYEPADFTDAGNAGVDIIHIQKTSEDFPARDVFAERGGFNRDGGRCSRQDFDLGFDLRVPDDWLVPDAGPDNPYGLTPNSSFAIVTTDGLRSIQGQVLARCEVGGPIFMPDFMRFDGNRKESSLRGDGLDIGTAGHGASGLSTLGGTIRLGELINGDPIRHAIKVNPYANKSLHYSEAVPGFRWPAGRADGYAGDPASEIRYNPNADSDIVMGSLLAIPPEATPESLGLTTVAGRKMFQAMQNYGVYFVEDAAFDTWDIVAERDVEIEFERTYGFGMDSPEWLDEMNKLMTSLSVITNNSPTSVGGGGTPRAALAPEFIPIPVPTFNVFRLRPLSDPTQAVTLEDAGPDGRFGFGNSHNLGLAPNEPDSALQLWKINEKGDLFQFESIGINRNKVCMDVDNSGFDGATNVHTWLCGDPEAENRLYELVPVPGGGENQFYVLPSHAKSKGYTNELRLTAEGGNLSSTPASDSDAQIFTLEPTGDNTVLEPFADRCENTGLIRYERYENLAGGSLSALEEASDFPADPDFTAYVTSLEAPANVGSQYGARMTAYICPPETGTYRFWVAGDDHAELYLSTDSDAANMRRIAFTSKWTNAQQWDRSPTQRSADITLEKGRLYYVEARLKENGGNDHLAVGWRKPSDGAGDSPHEVVPGSALAPVGRIPFFGLKESDGCTGTSGITYRRYEGIPGSDVGLLTSALSYPDVPDEEAVLSAFDAPVGVGDRYGASLQGYLCVPETGFYYFWIAGDDRAELNLSTDGNPANKQRIAFLDGKNTGRYQWNRLTSQRSSAIPLVAGRRYYIEGLLKENGGGDHLSVGWRTPSSGFGNDPTEVIPGRVLVPLEGTVPTPLSTDAELGARGQTTDQVTLFPNPSADGLMNLHLNGAVEGQLTVFSASGQLILRQPIDRAESQFRIERPGVYLVHVTQGEEVLAVRRVVVQ